MTGVYRTPIVSSLDAAKETEAVIQNGHKWEFVGSVVLTGETPIALHNTFVDVHPSSDLIIFGGHHSIINVKFNCIGDLRTRPILCFRGDRWEKRNAWLQGNNGLLYFTEDFVFHTGYINEVWTGALKPPPYFKNPASPTTNEIDMLQLINPPAYELVLDVMRYLKN